MSSRALASIRCTPFSWHPPRAQLASSTRTTLQLTSFAPDRTVQDHHRAPARRRGQALGHHRPAHRVRASRRVRRSAPAADGRKPALGAANPGSGWQLRSAAEHLRRGWQLRSAPADVRELRQLRRRRPGGELRRPSRRRPAPGGTARAVLRGLRRQPQPAEHPAAVLQPRCRDAKRSSAQDHPDLLSEPVHEPLDDQGAGHQPARDSNLAQREGRR